MKLLNKNLTDGYPLSRHILPHLEMHITHECNLRCEYCSHYCDFAYGGEVPYAQGEEWLRVWAERLEPEKFYILGGEPLLHLEVEKYLRLCAKIFPKAKKYLITNGLLLSKRDNVLAALIETDMNLEVSLHPLATERQMANMNDALALAYQYQKKGLRLKVRNSPSLWRKDYLGEKAYIRPFTDNDPARSFKNCPKAVCKTLHQGKLWKCPTLAYLPRIVDRLETKRFWEPYLQYTPLGFDASDGEIEKFIIGDSQFCDMCPTEWNHYVTLQGIIPNVINVIRARYRGEACPTL